MEAPSETKNPNPSTLTTEKNLKPKAKNTNFEFCKVCKLNHNQGRRHNYLPNHVKSLSSFLSRFQSKLSDVRFFFKNPSLLPPELASRNRFWCVFCDCDVTENHSTFTCEKGIRHLASADHLRNLKSFLWKYGGGMDRIDQFRFTEADLAKYEKKCVSVKSGSGSEQAHGPLIGPSNEMRNIRGGSGLTEGYHHNGLVYAERREFNGEGGSAGPKLTQISSTYYEPNAGNVHSGAPPPWFSASNGIHLDAVKTKPLKSKLNPKRVGAAWAERRKIEMEMEKRGALPVNRFDASWLPNFGRVWQSGSRKDSRKEFEVEAKKPVKDESQNLDSSMQLQPYISKRMRREANG